MSDTTPQPTHVEMEYEGVENHIQVPAKRVERYEARGWKRTQPAAEELKGKALDAALDAAGLSKDGTADEKRTRLAEHQSAQAID